MNINDFDNPLFVIGNPRSGTSLLRLILTTHSRILIPPECGFVIWLGKKYSDWRISDNNESGRLNDFLADLSTSKKFDTWSLDVQLIKDQIICWRPTNYAELCTVVYLAFGKASGKSPTIIGDKNNFHIDYLSELLSLYGKARFLHIIRDGRDVACSYREVMNKKSNSPYAPKLGTGASEIAEEWARNVNKVDSFLSLLPSKQSWTIRYEDLVLEPTATISSICDWLGLQFESEMLNFYQHNRRSGLEPELTMDWKQRTVHPISDETVGRYATVLSLEEQWQFESIAEQQLRKFSYI